ncbi:hypothetical protein D3C76_155660 [compost metagenome]
MLADFKADLFISQVGLGTKSAFVESFFNFCNKICLFISDIHDHRLRWREPGRERTFVVLDQNPDETLEGTEDRTVQHHWVFAAVVFRDVFSAQTDRQVKIELQSTTLPDPTKAVFQRELDLRTVERALTRLQIVRQASTIKGCSQCSFSAIPQLVGTDAFFRTSGQFHLDIFEAEIGVDVHGQLDERGGLGLHLLFGAEDVGVVLSERTYAHDAVQRTRWLVTVAGTELGQTHRQLAVALQALIEHLHVARAVHRLDGVVAVFRLRGEHVVGVVGPVPGFLPQAAVNDLRRLDFEVAVVALDLAHVLLEHLVQSPAVRVPEHHARRLFLGVEQAQALADLAVVAFFGFFDALDVRSQLLLVGPGGAVHALQLLVLGITAPVGAGQLGQLEGFQETRVRHVRTAAHVDVFFVIVQAHGLLVRHVFDQAQLVVFATGLEHFDHFGARSDFLDHVVIFLDQLLHALFDGGQVVRGERTFEGDVVIETFVDDRTDDHFGGRVQLLDRVANQVGARVANDLQPLFILWRDDLQRRVAVDDVAGVDQLAIDLAGNGGLGQACTDGCGDLGYGNRVIE